MATVEKDPARRKTPYVVRWRDEGGRQRKRGFPRKVDADRFRAEVEHSLNVGAYVDHRAGKVTFEVYAERWREAQPHRANTAKRVASVLSKHINPKLGSRPIAAIRPSEVQAFTTGLSATLAPGSVRQVFAVVRAVFGAAMRDRIIGRDPAERIKLPELPRPEVVPLTVEQVDQLAAAVPRQCRAMVVAAAGAGLRQAEVFGLQVADVDFLRRTIKVQRQVQPSADGPVVGPLKNNASYRTVPVGDVVVTALAEHLRQQPAEGKQFIFRTEGGQAWSRNVFNAQVWRPARQSAGLPEVGMHDCRHFYASALIRAGLSVKVVSARLGHANAAMTLNVYSHLWPDDADRSRQAIDDVFSRKNSSDVPTVRPSKGA